MIRLKRDRPAQRPAQGFHMATDTGSAFVSGPGPTQRPAQGFHMATDTGSAFVPGPGPSQGPAQGAGRRPARIRLKRQ